MLGMKSYPAVYVAYCRQRIDDNLAAYHAQLGGLTAMPIFEHRFFADQTLLLDYMFVHRLSGQEGKDGNPLVEVRIICNSLLLHHDIVQIDRLPDWPQSAVSGLKCPVETSILGLKDGDKIELTEADFCKLRDGFFAEIEKRYA
jgi:hypothetical protein